MTNRKPIRRQNTRKTATHQRIREIAALYFIGTLFTYCALLVYYHKAAATKMSGFEIGSLFALLAITLVAFRVYFFRFLHFIHEDRNMIVRIRARQLRKEKQRRAKRIALISKIHGEYVIASVTPTLTPGVFDVTFENRISDIAPPEIFANGKKISYVRKFDQVDFHTMRCDLFKSNAIDVNIDTIHFTCGHRPPVHVTNVYKSRFEHKSTQWKWDEYGELLNVSIKDSSKQFPHITDTIRYPFKFISNERVIAEVYGRFHPESDSIILSLEDVPTKNLIAHNNSIRYAFETVPV